MPRRRVNHHSLGLVHHKQVLVLVDYIEWYIFGQYIYFLRLGNFNRNPVPRF